MILTSQWLSRLVCWLQNCFLRNWIKINWSDKVEFKICKISKIWSCMAEQIMETTNLLTLRPWDVLLYTKCHPPGPPATFICKQSNRKLRLLHRTYNWFPGEFINTAPTDERTRMYVRTSWPKAVLCPCFFPTYWQSPVTVTRVLPIDT